MSATSEVPAAAGARLPARDAPAARSEADQKTTARLWILNGALWFALAAYCWSAWVISGDFQVNTIGRGDEPDWYVTLMRGWEVFALVVTLVILWVFVVRPKIKTGRLSFDGLFFLGCGMMFLQEPWINWTSYQFLYSTTSVNFGSWLGHTPFWSSPNPELVPVSAWAGTAYLWLVAIPGWAGAKFMGRIRERRPLLGNWGLVACAFAAFCVFDIVLEGFITRTQLFSYGSVIPELSLFAGTDHQFPLYETVCWAGTYTVLASLYFFRDDRGRSLPERGIDALRIRSGKLKTFARFLAIMGVCQLTILLTYNIPYAVFGLHSEMPDVFVEREWRTGGVCGPETAYNCPTPEDPLARGSSPTNRIDPDAAP